MNAKDPLRGGSVRADGSCLHRGPAEVFVNDAEWDKQRERSILAAFQTGRPVFADSDGELRYADGIDEPVAADVGLSKKDLPQAATAKPSWWTRVWLWWGGGS